MATAVVMPKAGNSVESCIIVDWKKQVGDVVAVDDVLCEVETDKATMDVPSPAAGTLLALFFKAGDEVPVMTNVAVVGQPGEDVSSLAPAGATQGMRGHSQAAGCPLPAAPSGRRGAGCGARPACRFIAGFTACAPAWLHAKASTPPHWQARALVAA